MNRWKHSYRHAYEEGECSIFEGQGICAHYHNTPVEEVGLSCPAAWADPKHQVECIGCEDLRFCYQIVMPNGVDEYFSINELTPGEIKYLAALYSLNHKGPQ